jgi:Kef-type K+ transport system membrane component KefB
MEHLTVPQLTVPQFLGLLVVILLTAKLGGALARWIGQPAVLGELLAGVLLGGSVFGFVDPTTQVIHLLAELGVVILLFEIGLETDLRKLLKVGGASLAVALVGVVLPFALGYAACWTLGLPPLVSIFAGASLTATSVGITARVLSDLGRLQEPEGQVILGAAILDDVVGLVILAVVTGMAQGEEVTVAGVAKTTAIAFGFLIVTLLVGRFMVPGLAQVFRRIDLPGTTTILSLVVALALAWLAHQSGSALIIGAFAAGLLLRDSPYHEEIEHGVARLGHFFVPIFFVSVGAAVDVRAFSPFDPAARTTLLLGGLLLVGAIAGKFAAGYAPFWFKANKNVIGVGMIPRGEVGLIFAQLGLSEKVFDQNQFSAVALMVIVTTFMAPPLLKWLLPATAGEPSETQGLDELVVGERSEQ